jgi:hypothetical protein
MRIRASFPAAVALTAVSVVAACGLEMGGLETAASDDGGGADGPVSTGSGSGGSFGSTSSSGTSSTSSGGTSSGTSSGGSDATVNDGPAQQDSPPLQDGGCTPATGCYVIPPGWQLVAFAPQQGAACPPGFAKAPPTNLVEGPNTASACACGCTLQKQPMCNPSPVQVHYDSKILPGAGQCASPGQPATTNNNPPGGCGTQDMFHGPYDNLDLKYDPPAANGGSCMPTSATGIVTYAALDTSCQPDNNQAAGCTGDQCSPNIPSPYIACVTKNGKQACPGAPFTQPHDVGTTAQVTCGGACGCNVSATCTGTMKLFTRYDCTTMSGGVEVDIVADGTCQTSTGVSGMYGSYSYVPNPPANAACQSTGTTTVQNVMLTGEQTICCTQ